MSILIHSEFENFLFSSSFHQESLVFFLLSSSIAKHAEKRSNSSRTLHELFTNSEEKRGRSEERETRTDEKDDLSEPSWSSIKLGGADPNFETINSDTPSLPSRERRRRRGGLGGSGLPGDRGANARTCSAVPGATTQGRVDCASLSTATLHLKPQDPAGTIFTLALREPVREVCARRQLHLPKSIR